MPNALFTKSSLVQSQSKMSGRKAYSTAIPRRSELRLQVLGSLANGSAAGLPKVTANVAASCFGAGMGTLDAYLAGARRARLDKSAELAANDLARAGLVRLTPANDMQISAAGRSLLAAMDGMLANAGGGAGRGGMRPAISDAVLSDVSPAYRQWQYGPPAAAAEGARHRTEGFPRETSGIVAAIDMLGTSKAWETRDQIKLQYLWKDLVDLARQVLRPEDGFGVTTESDAIKVTGGGRPTAELLKAFGMASWRIVVRSMQYSVPVRGCVAAGSYCSGLENLVTGRAVEEASVWHDRAQWIGIMAAPSAGAVLDCMDRTDAAGIDAMHEYYARYAIPSKAGTNAAWAVNWPRQCEATGAGGGPKGMMRIIKASLGRPLDRGAARKWLNTRRFCSSVIRGWDPYRKWAPPGPA